MKRIVLTLTLLSLLLVFGVNVCAQNMTTDGFFHTNYELYRDNSDWGVMPLLPRTHGYHYDYDAEDPVSVPIGSGLLLLSAMSIGYFVVRKKDK